MLQRLKRASAGNARAGVSLDGSRLALARMRRLDGGGLSLAACAFRAEEDEHDWTERAALRMGDMHMRQTPVSAVLRADAYQLQLVETPNVPEQEMRAAIRWRIKDLIDYPVEEAAIDLIEMPRHANPGNKPIAYAVVSHRSEILDQIDFMERADLQMDVIDIPELCVRNIAARLPQDSDGVAFLHVADDCGYLTITRQRVLYLIRRVEIGRRALVDSVDDDFSFQERVAGISLEVQRSLDYYESHYDCRPVAELVIGPGAELDQLPVALTENLGLSVSRITLDELFNMEREISPEEQGNCLLAVGAALRPAEAAAKTGSS